jgi:hypothetical protein
MELTREQLIEIHLAGTVALPGPYPESGRIKLQHEGYKLKGEEKASGYVRLEYRVSPKRTVVRIIPMEHVSAILWTSQDKTLGVETGDWWLGSEVINLRPKKGGKPPKGPDVKPQGDQTEQTSASGAAGGIVFVQETAPVLLQIEMGVTAAESLETDGMDPGVRCDPCCRPIQ